MSEILTPVKAIRAYCLGCMCGQVNEVALCPIKNCELYPYRFGKNPNYKPKEYTEAQKANMRENAKKMREKMKAKKSGDVSIPPTEEKAEAPQNSP